MVARLKSSKKSAWRRSAKSDNSHLIIYKESDVTIVASLSLYDYFTKNRLFQILCSRNIYFFLVREKYFSREGYISPSRGKFYKVIFIAKRHLSKLFNPIKEYNIRFWTICSSRLKCLMFTAEVFVGLTKEKDSSHISRKGITIQKQHFWICLQNKRNKNTLKTNRTCTFSISLHCVLWKSQKRIYYKINISYDSIHNEIQRDIRQSYNR